MLQPTPSPDTEITAQLQRQIAELQSQLRIAKTGWERAEWKLQQLLRKLFGAKSEKIDPNQLALLSGQIEADQELAAETAPPIPALPVEPESNKAKKGGGRHPAPRHLNIETTLIDLPEEQKAGLQRIREEVTEEYEYQPSRYYLHRIVRPVYADPAKQVAPQVAELPPRVIPQSGAGPGLLAHILVSKFVDHLPLYRLEQIAARSGVELPRQKQCRWVEHCAHLLRTIHEQLKDNILAGGYVQVDETPVKVLDADRGGKAAQSYLWTYHAPNQKMILFDFNLSRGRDSPDAFFPKDWSGVLQSDGYELYRALIRDRPHITHIGCMAHLRRHLVDAIDGGGAVLASLLADIGKLYGLEKQAREKGHTHAQRACLRHAYARPILKSLQLRFAALKESELPSGALGKAAAYAVNHWPQIARYAKARFGHVNIDNNPIERGIRPTKLGMKNWLFIGHPSAGWRSAVIYSITGTCKLIGVNPESYFRWVLPQLAAATNHTAKNLLPHDFAALQLN
jgi:transposase